MAVGLDDPAREPIATTATLTRWLPVTRTGTGRLSLGQLVGLRPRPETAATEGRDKTSGIERPNRPHPPRPMPPAGGDAQQLAA